MSNSGKQSPLGINVTGSILQNVGLTINPIVTSYMGTSKTNSSYTPGSIVGTTCLNYLTYAIQNAFNGGLISNATYNNLIAIGSATIPALGNSKPYTYDWAGVANTGYYLDEDPGPEQGQSQTATWVPYTTANTNSSITQWGFMRLYALQAWNEFNWNGIPAGSGMPEYKDFVTSFLTAQGFIENSNKPIAAAAASSTFLKGTFSNMNDLITANITGVNLSTFQFGQDCITAGKIIDLTKIAKFGLPSVLLQTARKYNALTPALVLALLSADMSVSDIQGISSGTSTASRQQEQQIYGSFLVILGNDLNDILIPLNCKTTGLLSLADLLNVKKIFPNCYQSLTVPVYNLSAGPTNSKTYYPIFQGDGVSPRLNTTAIKEQIGTIIIPGTPAIIESIDVGLNFQTPATGFGSYLSNILPDDIAISAGAFSYSMQQITKISSTDFESFAQVVCSIETAKGLTLIGGTDVPTNPESAQQVTELAALGSGPNGTYTMSDFFGCMSGLPYLWPDIDTGVRNLQSTTLTTTYTTLYLVASWAVATVTITYTYDPYPGTELYTVTNIVINLPGGGYGFSGAPAPTVTSNCTSANSTTIGTNSSDLSTYGKVTSLTYTINAPQSSIPSFVIDFPPGGVSYPNATVQTHIDAANVEIASILAANPGQANILNVAYNAAGIQLTVEQRARFNGIPAVPSPDRSTFLNPYPSALYIFVDSIPSIAKNTIPHMYSQTLEAISDFSTIGGESIVGMMRQERNQVRLQSIGLELDNNIPDETPEDVQQLLIANGTAAVGLVGITVYGINGAGSSNQSDPGSTFTVPSSLIQVDSNGNQITPVPMGYLDPNIGTYCLTGGVTTLGQTSPLQEILSAAQNNLNNTNILGPSFNGTGPAIVDNIVAIRTGAIMPVGPCLQDLDVGKAVEPGSMAGSASSNLLPASLNMAFSSSTVFPSVYSVSEAIEDVILCNCDCWID